MTRIEYARVAPDAIRAMLALETYVRQAGIPAQLLHLVKLRASYINGCAYCVDMHAKDALAEGETPQRVYSVPVWRETPFYTPRERAALAWTESLTDLPRDEVNDELFAEARRHFEEDELVRLTMAVVAINGWNRIAVSFRTEPGTYVSRAAAKAAQVA